MLKDNTPDPNPQPPDPQVTGWPLEEALAALQSNPQTQDYPIRLVETAPPVRPPRVDKQPKKHRGKEETAHRPPVLHTGEWRVLRCRIIETDDSAVTGEIELIVGREQVSEELLTARPEAGASE